MHFVPAHPVAGTEHSGPDAGFAELFVGRWCILTPPPDADPAAVERLAAFWRALGANVETMSAEHHDLVLGITSHLPHLIAYTIVGTADELCQVTRSEVLQFSAGGFRDFTRIAASDPTMWRDVFLANKDAVLEMLGRFNEDLVAAHARDPPRRRRHAVRAFHPHPRDPPRHRRDRPGFSRPRFRPRASRPAGYAAAAALRGGGRVMARRWPSACALRAVAWTAWLLLPLLGMPSDARAQACKAPVTLQFNATSKIVRSEIGFTQGLEFHNGALYESTGRIGGTTRLNRISLTGQVTPLVDPRHRRVRRRV